MRVCKDILQKIEFIHIEYGILNVGILNVLHIKCTTYVMYYIFIYNVGMRVSQSV